MLLIIVSQTVVLAASLSKSGGAVTAVKTVTATDQVTTTSSGSVPGMSTSITIPDGQKALLVITFSAVTYCYDGSGGGECHIRVLVDGSDVPPGDSVFASTNEGLTTHSMQYVSGPKLAGQHTVSVSYWFNSEIPD